MSTGFTFDKVKIALRTDVAVNQLAFRIIGMKSVAPGAYRRVYHFVKRLNQKVDCSTNPG